MKMCKITCVNICIYCVEIYMEYLVFHALYFVPIIYGGSAG
jgi:hypothetical protein